MKRRNFFFMLPGFLLVKRVLPEPTSIFEHSDRFNRSSLMTAQEAAKQYNETYANILHTLTEWEGLVSLEQANRLYFK